MSTSLKPEISEKNVYWIGKHRYYELRHFCLQYPIWKKAYESLNALSKRPVALEAVTKRNGISNPTAKCAESMLYFSERIDMVNRVAFETDELLSKYILLSVTEGLSYDHMKARLEIPCCRDVFYKLYRRFFWLLSESRQ